MDQLVIKRALQALPGNGDLYEIINPSTDGREQSIYSKLAILGYVKTTETEENGIVFVGITELGKRKLATL